MALGLPSSGGGDRVPIIKFDARAGRLFRVDRSQGAGGQWDSETVEITPGFQAVFDMANIELGWLSFPQGGAPSIVVAPFGQPLPARPDLNHKAGFRVHLQLGKSVGGDVREMASNAQASIAGMDVLHDAYLTGVKANPGKLPVVKLPRTKAIVSAGKAASSTNYEPCWEIVAWVDRPEKLSPEAIAKLRSGGNAPEGSGPATQQPLPEPEREMASVSDDF
jgi:hypothetical protein